MKNLLRWINQFLLLSVTPSDGTVSARRQPLGYIQITPTGTSAKIPLATLQALLGPNPGYSFGYAVIQCIGAAATDYAGWRDDGTAAAATVGMRLYSAQELDYTGDIYNIQFIIGAGTPVLNISLYA
jgi:hypothetical protein